jgi:hypothetical protein
MKRPQETKNIQGLFVNISKKSKSETFIKKFSYEDDEINNLIKRYESLIETHKNGLEELAHIEQLIMQISSRKDLSPIKYSTVKGLIYARTPFYRFGYKIKDIRVIVGTVEECGKMTKEELLSKSKEKLVHSMDKIIFSNFVNYEKEFSNMVEQETV